MNDDNNALEQAIETWQEELPGWRFYPVGDGSWAGYKADEYHVPLPDHEPVKGQTLDDAITQARMRGVFG